MPQLNSGETCPNRSAVGCGQEDATMKTKLALALAGMIFISAAATTAFAASKANRISISYVLPKNPGHQPIYAGLKERRALERLQEFLSPFRLPRTLKISL